jgi:PDZ domain-containing protein
VRRLFSPTRLVILGLLLLAVALALFIAPSNDYIFLPDQAHPVAPLVTVQGAHVPKNAGEIFFVDVIVRKATLLERLFGGLHKGAQLYPASAVDPPGVNQAGREQIDVEDMQLSQQIAAAVALKALGRKVVMRPIGARVDQLELGTPADGKLHPDDVIVDIDGTRVTTLAAVRNAIGKHKAGQVVRFTVIRATKTLVIPIRTIPDPTTKRQIVGIVIEPAVDIHLPIKVSIDAGNVGGPSAGLAFALEVMEQLGRDVVHGHKVAATGELEPDGTVEPIGGIKQKTIGVREAGADVFLVPAGDNAAEARKEAGGLRIIPVESFQQALHALATLPPVTQKP